jgi:hypothetical protein
MKRAGLGALIGLATVAGGCFLLDWSLPPVTGIGGHAGMPTVGSGGHAGAVSSTGGGAATSSSSGMECDCGVCSVCDAGVCVPNELGHLLPPGTGYDAGSCRTGVCDGDGNAMPSPMGTCVLGEACAIDSDCKSNHCFGRDAGSTCCSSQCDAGDATCGATACDVSGACIFPDASTLCAGIFTPPVCLMGVLTPNACDGKGNCDMTMALCDDGFLCDSTTTCATSCAQLAGTCQKNYFCNMDAGCETKRDSGSDCSNGYECISTHCQNNSCN